MSAITPQAGAFAGIYIGDYGVDTVLTKVTSIRTGGCPVSDETPRDFLDCVGMLQQSGRRAVGATLYFYDDGDTITKLCRGIPLSGYPSDDPSDAQYVIFLQNNNPTIDNSYLFIHPQIVTKFIPSYLKDSPTIVQVVITDHNRSRNVNILQKDTQANIVTALGARSPI